MSEEELIEKNRGLIGYAIKQMNCKWNNLDEKREYEDVAEIGLIKAIKTFDESKGNKLSSYIVACIKNEIRTLFTYKTNLKRVIPGGKLLSINMRMKESEDEEFIDFIPSDVNVEEEVINNILNKEAVDKLLNVLNKKQKEFVIEYYGLYGNNPKTMEQLAKIHKISKTAVYGVLERAILRMRKKGAKYYKLIN